MNLLIISDKADVKLYQSIAKSAPNISVLGAITRIDSGFINLLKERYNPHAILLDTDTPSVDTDIKTTIEQIKSKFSHMKILVLTRQEDNQEYSADYIIQGRISNLKLKEILSGMSNGSPLPDFEYEKFRENDVKHSPYRIHSDLPAVDKMSTGQVKKVSMMLPKFTTNPFLFVGIAVGILAMIVLILVIIKAGSTIGTTSTPDETDKVVESEAPTYFTVPASTTAVVYPVQSQTEAFPETTIAPATEPHTIVPIQAPKTDPPRGAKIPETTNVPVKENIPSSTRNSPSKESNSSSVSSRSSTSSPGNNGSMSNKIADSEPIAAEPHISYDNNVRYKNTGGNAVTSVKLSYTSKTLNVKDTLQLEVTVSPITATQTVTWNSSNSSVVSVSNGKITAKRVGKATVTATANNGKSASCEVTVKKREQTDSVHLSATEYHISVGQSITVTLYGATDCTWSLSNSNPVTISSRKNQATVRARRKGKTQIYAKNTKTNKVYVCDIFVE